MSALKRKKQAGLILDEPVIFERSRPDREGTDVRGIGTASEYLPQELGWGSGMTAWRRLHAWQRKGVWQKIHAALLSHLHGADEIDWSRAIVDSSSVRAMHGGKKRAPIQRIVANPAASIT